MWWETIRGHWKNWQMLLFWGRGFSQKSHSRLQTIFCIHTGQRVEAWRVNFCSFDREGGVSSETNFVCFSGLLQTFAMAPKHCQEATLSIKIWCRLSPIKHCLRTWKEMEKRVELLTLTAHYTKTNAEHKHVSEIERCLEKAIHPVGKKTTTA